ncbi:MAG TPA: TSUP family transporter, partial [Frankiaceae bacterium]|nr:TSUP family transporter [Frankiaceae bacterium]
AGAAGGAVNAAAGGGSLLTFPALLATGNAALVANVTNTVGLVPGYLGGVLGYRRELAGQGGRIGVLAVDAVAGAVAGVAVLLTAPQSVFRAVVPALLVAACLLLLAQPWLAAVARRRARPDRGGRVPPTLHVAVLAGSAYGAYFGAALGVLLLALLGVVLNEDLHRVNALKGAVTLVTNVVAAVGYAALGPVNWAAAAVVAGASVGGGFGGAVLARRIPPGVLRVGVAVVGLVAAGRLLAG